MLGIEPPDFSHCMSADRPSDKFTLEEYGAIAEELDAPPGWPFVDWETGDKLRAVRKLMAPEKKV